MKSALTVITVLFVVAVLALVGYKAFNFGNIPLPDRTSSPVDILAPDNQEQFSPDRIYACTDNGVRSKKYKGLKSVTSDHLLNTSCLGPDGNAYDAGTRLTFYAAAEQTGDLEPSCSSMTKTCINGIFQGNDPAGSHTRLECRIIGQTTGEIVTCTSQGKDYLPGESIYRYQQEYVALDEDCTQALAYCNGNGERYSKFPDYTAHNCRFLRGYSTGYLAANQDTLTVVGGSTIRPEKVSCTAMTGGSQCQTPRGTRVDHGESFLSFKEQQVSFDESCHIRATTCLDGEWSNNLAPYPHPTCQRSEPASCEFNNIIIEHDTSMTFYRRNIDAEGDISCDQETKYCFNGELEGNDSFQYRVCDPNAPEESSPSDTPPAETVPEQADETETDQQQSEAQDDAGSPATDTPQQPIPTTSQRDPNCPHPFGGATPREPWEEGSAYRQATVPYGSTCQEIPIVCAYGAIRQGTAQAPGEPVSNLTANCTVSEPADCSHSCGDRNHGEALLTYQTDSIEHGAGETCQDYEIKSTCTNGTFTPTPGDYCTCEVANPVGCVTAGGVRVAHNNSLTLFKDNQIEAEAEDGSDICLRQHRTCLNGQWYNDQGEVAAFTYQYETCEVVAPSE